MPTAASGALSVAELRRAYLERQTEPADVLADTLARVLAADPGVWISVADDGTLQRRAAELTRLRERDRTLSTLPLFGVPFAVKDNIDVAGLATTAACPDFSHRPRESATAVRHLLDAGAICIGKTNLDQFATGLTGTRSPYGAVSSVFGRGLISGGSSSGSAVAVAAEQVNFALGTDTAGSGRVPAAMNGLVGIKPTRGLVSTHGMLPACRSLDCVSVFSTDVAGGLAVMAVLSRPDPADPWSRGRPVPARPPRPLGSVRLGLPAAADLDFFGDEDMRQAHTAARERTGALVSDAVLIDLGPFREAGDLLYSGPWVAERLAGLEEFLRAHPGSVLPVTRAVIERGREYDAVAAFRARHRLQELRAWTDRLWQRVDAILLPTVGTTFTHDEIAADPIGTNTTLGAYTMFANLLDLAAVTVPAGLTADGRPVSVSLIGPAFSDDSLAGLGAAMLAEPPPPPAAQDGGLLLAVVGHHLAGEPRNGELLERGAVLVGPARTTPRYRLYALPGDVPGLVRVSGGGAPIDVELWQLPADGLGSLLAGVRAPLGLGWLELDGGRQVIGFLCEAYAAGPDARDITDLGGWRAYRRAALA